MQIERHAVTFLKLVLFFIFLPHCASAQNSVWKRADAANPQGELWVKPQKFHAFQLDNPGIRAALKRAPLETPQQRIVDGMELELPMPDGSLARYKVVEAPVMAPELAAKFPEIKTYVGIGIDDPTAAVRFDTTPAGFHAQILSPKGAVYIDPYVKGNTDLHVAYYKRDYKKAPDGFKCLTVTEEAVESNLNRTELLRSGSTLRTYRLACAATGEYTAFHGGTVSAGMAAIVTAINRVTGVYETELAIRLVLVANNNLLVYTTANTDPYSNDNGSTMLGQNQSNIDSIIGSANYDIGHVFSTGGGGIAGLGVVCVANNKARGVTGLPTPVGDAFYIDYVAHEMGHQFGGNHTFNSVTSNCGGGNRNASTAYEPGSGTTIMAYAGICGADDLQLHSDPYFHSISFDEITTYVSSGGGSSCPVNTATGNSVPTVNAGANYTIPKSTPFTLTASGNDLNGDTLTYCWEERDLGASQLLTDPDNGSSPLFRSFNPTTDPTRTFPKLSAILNNTTSLGEKLPTTSRTMTFRATVRDNRSGGGGVNTDDMQVTIVSGAGPFTVSAPNGGETVAGRFTVTWNVSGTTAAPISAANVNILLSTNGGLTFPIVLRTNTPNDGSESILFPNIATSQARVKIEATGNIFFDLSNSNFSLANYTPEADVIIESVVLTSESCGATNNAVDPGETVTMQFSLKNSGSIDATNITATLQALNGITSPSGTQNYGTLVSNGAAVARPFTFIATGTCGGTVNSVLQVRQGATLLATITNSIRLGGFALQSYTGSNTNQIKVPNSGNSGSGFPYPSTINISGVPGTISKVTVTLTGVAHAYPDDMDVLLVAPSGQTVLLMSDAGGGGNIFGANLTFDDAAVATLSDTATVVSGTYQPSNFESTSEGFASPAPAEPFGSALSTLIGGTPNGTWSLYTQDDQNPDKGTINSWTITITTATPSCCMGNSAPVISSIGNQTTSEDVSIGVNFTVSDADTIASALSVSVTSSNTNLVAPSGLLLGGSGTNRTLMITPAPNQSGTSTITISVNDGALTNSTNFILTVNAVNDGPTLTAIANHTINELSLLTFTNTAFDVDTPSSSFSYSLSNAPAGMSINSSGVLTWTPSEAQGPGTYNVGVQVNDNGGPNLSDSKSFSVTVNEVNSAPNLLPIANRTIHAGTAIILTNSASDADVPTNNLSFNFALLPPLGATLGVGNGVFSWTPNDTQTGTNQFAISVSDNGAPSMSDTEAFSIVVVARPSLSIARTANDAILSWTTISGTGYTVQSIVDLTLTNWTSITNITATGTNAAAAFPVGAQTQFYRIKVNAP